jgi:2-polyprenyl-3-methyl-5-hydroxy-6-metoxy-1,4-benzoquinol methylase
VEQRQENADIETASDGYAQRFAGATGKWMLQCQTNIVLDLLGPASNTSILDVGGGHAQLARPLVEAGYSVTVHGSAQECQARITDLLADNTCNFVCSSMFELPFKNKAVDTLLCFRLLTHCNDWEALIAELCRVADRKIIIDYPSTASLNALLGCFFSVKKKLEGNTRTWRLFSRSELESVFSKHGFHCTQQKKQFFLPMVLHRALRNPSVSSTLESICQMLGFTYLWGSPVLMELGRKSHCD